MAWNTGPSSPGEELMTSSTCEVAVCCSSASLSFFSRSRACAGSFVTSSDWDRRAVTARALAFVLLERSLRPCVRLFALLRDKVTPAARPGTQGLWAQRLRKHTTTGASGGSAVYSVPLTVELQVAADSPARVLQPLHEGNQAELRFRIVGGRAHEHADP